MPIIRDLTALHPAFQPIVHDWLAAVEKDGINILVVETRRTLEVQQAYWARGRQSIEQVKALYAKAGLAPPESNSMITKVPPGFGWHPYGLAVDFVPMVNGRPDWNYTPDDPADYYDEIVAEAQKLGMIWGGSFRTFKDNPHVEWHPGYAKSAEAKTIATLSGDWKIPIPKGT